MGKLQLNASALQKELERANEKSEALQKELELQKSFNMLAMFFINNKGLANEFIISIPTQLK